MTNGAQPTIGAFLLPVGFGKGDEGALLDPVLASLRVAAAAMGGNVIWPEVRREVATRLAEILDVDISDVVVEAWEKAQEFREYTDPELHPPDETIMTELAEHTIEVDYHPLLEFLLNDNALPAVQLDIILSLIVKGLILKIRDGKVREMTAGSIIGQGRLETAGLTILEKQTEEILLPRARKVETPSDAPQPPSAPPSGLRG
jgi:hypothetical protein